MSVRSLIKRTKLGKKIAEKHQQQRIDERVFRSQCLAKEGSEVLTALSDALMGADIPFWLEFGSLLGYYREHGFIEHDDDIDIGVFLYDFNKVRSALLANGFEFVIEHSSDSVPGKEDCFRYKDLKTTVDVYYFTRGLNDIECTEYGPLVNPSFHIFFNTKVRPLKVHTVSFPFNGLTKTSFMGVDIYVPTDTHEHLVANYGENYMTPDPDFYYPDVATNIKFWDYSVCKGKEIIHQDK